MWSNERIKEYWKSYFIRRNLLESEHCPLLAYCLYLFYSFNCICIRMEYFRRLGGKFGIDQGRILLIKNVFFKFYKQLYSILDIEDKYAEAIAVTDLSNLLLANQLKLPLWTEKNAESWINEVYHFRTRKRSELITLPIISGNPRNYLRDALTKMVTLFNQEVKFEEIVKQLKEDAKKALKIVYLSKGVVLSTLEPLPIWENLELPYRYLVSAILTIIDTVAMKEFVKF